MPEGGLYKVELHFSEIHWNRSVARIFDLEIENGQYISQNINLYKQQGPNVASVLIMENIKVTDGLLNINLIKKKDYAKISGIVLYKQADLPNLKLVQPPKALLQNEWLNLQKRIKLLMRRRQSYILIQQGIRFIFILVRMKWGEWSFKLVTPRELQSFGC